MNCNKLRRQQIAIGVLSCAFCLIWLVTNNNFDSALHLVLATIAVIVSSATGVFVSYNIIRIYYEVEADTEGQADE